LARRSPKDGRGAPELAPAVEAVVPAIAALPEAAVVLDARLRCGGGSSPVGGRVPRDREDGRPAVPWVEALVSPERALTEGALILPAAMTSLLPRDARPPAAASLLLCATRPTRAPIPPSGTTISSTPTMLLLPGGPGTIRMDGPFPFPNCTGPPFPPLTPAKEARICSMTAALMGKADEERCVLSSAMVRELTRGEARARLEPPPPEEVRLRLPRRSVGGRGTARSIL